MTRTLFAAGLLAVVACVSAPAQTMRLKADVPFDFRLGAAVMPAGQYTIHRSGDVLTLRTDTGARKAAMALVQGAVRPRSDTAGKLVFNRYGNAYFLSKVWAPGSETGQTLRPTAIEKEYISRARGAVETAGIPVQYK